MSTQYDCEKAKSHAKKLNKILGTCLVLATATIIVLSVFIHKEMDMIGGGARVAEVQANQMVKDYHSSSIHGIFGGTTSYLMSIDSLLLLTKADTSIKHIHAFFGIHNGGITLVFTGARAISPGGTSFVNVPFKDAAGRPFDVEHVFPCVGINCRVINADGTTGSGNITVPEFPDNN